MVEKQISSRGFPHAEADSIPEQLKGAGSHIVLLKQLKAFSSDEWIEPWVTKVLEVIKTAARKEQERVDSYSSV